MEVEIIQKVQMLWLKAFFVTKKIDSLYIKKSFRKEIRHFILTFKNCYFDKKNDFNLKLQLQIECTD